ncbi:hypothetical protein E4U25_008014, partial [Claviceps purpurea]
PVPGKTCLPSKAPTDTTSADNIRMFAHFRYQFMNQRQKVCQDEIGHDSSTPDTESLDEWTSESTSWPMSSQLSPDRAHRRTQGHK